MRNRVPVTIAGETYTIVGEQNPDYIRRVAGIVDEKVRGIHKTGGMSLMQSMALAACDIADDYLQAVESADNLRAQMKNYLEEASALRAQIAELKRQK